MSVAIPLFDILLVTSTSILIFDYLCLFLSFIIQKMASSRSSFFLFLLFVWNHAQGISAESSEGIVAAYVPEYRFYADVESAISCCLTDVMLFSASVEIGGRVDNHWLPAKEIRRVRKAADEVPHRAVYIIHK